MNSSPLPSISPKPRQEARAEDYLREAFLGELKSLCLPDGEDDFSYRRLDGRSLELRQLEEAVNAMPLPPPGI